MRVRKSHALVGAAVLLGGGTIGAALLGNSVKPPRKSASSSVPVKFASFTPRELAVAGVRLTAPRGASSAAGKTGAEAAARRHLRLPVREAHFAHCTVGAERHPQVDEDCWAVSLDPKNFANPGGPIGAPARPFKYVLVLVAPGTDRILETNGG